MDYYIRVMHVDNLLNVTLNGNALSTRFVGQYIDGDPLIDPNDGGLLNITGFLQGGIFVNKLQFDCYNGHFFLPQRRNEDNPFHFAWQIYKTPDNGITKDDVVPAVDLAGSSAHDTFITSYVYSIVKDARTGDFKFNSTPTLKGYIPENHTTTINFIRPQPTMDDFFVQLGYSVYLDLNSQYMPTVRWEIISEIHSGKKYFVNHEGVIFYLAVNDEDAFFLVPMGG